MPDAWLVRNLTGVAVPGGVGEVQLHTPLEVGHGKGPRVLERDLRWGGGIRLPIS